MLVSALSLLLLGPSGDHPGPTDITTDVHECVHPDAPGAWSDIDGDPSPATIDCNESTDTGYVQGSPFEITVVTVDGKPVEVETANAFYLMAQAAAADGVTLKVNSGFRTMAEQQYFYNCYINCSCNNCNVAAKPGYSNHQSGHALDINTASPGVYNWLANHGGSYGWERTVPSEDWHWEWWGGGPAANGPCGKPDYKAVFAAQSFPPASAPPVVLTVGDVLDAWIDLENVGETTWTGNTRLAPTPRDQPSPFFHDSWLSPTRITGPSQDVPPGNVGHFAFKFAASAPGDYYQTFGLVEEGTTWFSDKPLGGGPPDDQLEIHILVIAGTPPVPPPPAEQTTGGEASDDGGDADSGTGVGDGGEAGDDTGAPTSDGSAGSTGSATSAASGDSGDPSASAGQSEGQEGCGCNTRSASGLGFALLVPMLLGRARKRRVISP